MTECVENKYGDCFKVMKKSLTYKTKNWMYELVKGPYTVKYKYSLLLILNETILWIELLCKWII